MPRNKDTSITTSLEELVAELRRRLEMGDVQVVVSDLKESNSSTHTLKVSNRSLSKKELYIIKALGDILTDSNLVKDEKPRKSDSLTLTARGTPRKQRLPTDEALCRLNVNVPESLKLRFDKVLQTFPDLTRTRAVEAAIEDWIKKYEP